MKKDQAAVDKIWANLVHLSFNFWSDVDYTKWENPPKGLFEDPDPIYRPNLQFDSKLWDEMLKKMAYAGVNMVLIDLGDGVKWDSHPEIAVKKAWSTDRLKRELAKMRKMGIEPIPKLNFSTCHDAWMGPYSRCVSSDIYYTVCRDLIAEAIDLFDKPRFFHLGMDEETAEHQVLFEYAVIRQHDLWWNDLYFLVKQVENAGSRAWIWSDYIWKRPEVFLKKMPKSVLQSNWYYYKNFKKNDFYVKGYHLLEDNGYDQVPAGSNWGDPKNFEMTVKYCDKLISPEHLKGYLMTTWAVTQEHKKDKLMDAIDIVARCTQKAAKK
jgi:hypothetical protein